MVGVVLVVGRHPYRLSLDEGPRAAPLPVVVVLPV